MAVIEAAQEIPHLGGIRSGFEPEHALVSPPYEQVQETVEAFDEFCIVYDSQRILRVGNQIVELTRHEEESAGLKYETRSVIADSPSGFRIAMSILTPLNGAEFGLEAQRYGGVHRHDARTAIESPMHPELHWNRYFRALVTQEVKPVYVIERISVLR